MQQPHLFQDQHHHNLNQLIPEIFCQSIEVIYPPRNISKTLDFDDAEKRYQEPNEYLI